MNHTGFFSAFFFKSFVLSFSSFFAIQLLIPIQASADTLWVNKRSDKTMSLWSAKKNEKIMVARHQFKPSKNTRRKIGNQEELFKSVENEKRTLLSWVGVNNWTPSSYEWKDATDGGILTIKGTYEDNSGQLVGFIEKHKYSKNSETAIQDVLTVPLKDKKAEMDADLVKSFLSGGFE